MTAKKILAKNFLDSKNLLMVKIFGWWNFLMINFLMVKIFLLVSNLWFDFYCISFIPYAAPKLTKFFTFAEPSVFSVFYFLLFQIIFQLHQVTVQEPFYQYCMRLCFKLFLFQNEKYLLFLALVEQQELQQLTDVFYFL